MSALERIAAALERLVEIEEAREHRTARRRAPTAAAHEPAAPVVDDFTARRARELLKNAGVGKATRRGPTTPGRKR